MTALTLSFTLVKTEIFCIEKISDLENIINRRKLNEKRENKIKFIPTKNEIKLHLFCQRLLVKV